MCGILCLIKNGEIDIDQALECLKKLIPRGPDKINYLIIKPCNDIQIFLGFTRLAVMDVTDAGLQPFEYNGNCIVCNGEIYDYKMLANKYDISMTTDCDCELFLPLYEKLELSKLLEEINSEFALSLYDCETKYVHASRDRFGVRPLFYGYNKKTNTIAFSSELKAIHSIMDYVSPVVPGLIYSINVSKELSVPIESNIEYSCYYNYDMLDQKHIYYNNELEIIKSLIKDTLIKCVESRLEADRPMGFLLSGGLDSSLIVSIASKLLKPENVICFSIGLEDSPDIIAAKKVVQF